MQAVADRKKQNWHKARRNGKKLHGNKNKGVLHKAWKPMDSKDRDMMDDFKCKDGFWCRVCAAAKHKEMWIPARNETTTWLSSGL